MRNVQELIRSDRYCKKPINLERFIEVLSTQKKVKESVKIFVSTI